MFYMVQYPGGWTVQSNLSPGRPVHSDTTRLLWEAFSHAAITREDYSHIFPPLSIARYSFIIQLSELVHRRDNENAHASKQQQRGFEPRLSIEIPAFFHQLN